MTASACTQPGCGGTIQDGYCDVCGLAPAPAPAAPAAGWGPAPGAGSIRYAGASPGGAPSGGSGPSAPGTSGSGSVPFVSGPSGSSAWSTGLGSAGTGSGPGTRGSRPGSGRSSRGRLGAGLVEVPPVEALDPAAAVLADPRVPESRRFCGNCGQLVGQSRDGRPGMTEGFCPNCRTRYFLQPQAGPRRAGGRAVRGARLPRPRRARLDLPGQGPQRQRPLGGTQGPAQHRGRGRDGGRRRRGAVPRPARAPEHRPHLQLRPATPAGATARPPATS